MTKSAALKERKRILYLAGPPVFYSRLSLISAQGFCHSISVAEAAERIVQLIKDKKLRLRLGKKQRKWSQSDSCSVVGCNNISACSTPLKSFTFTDQKKPDIRKIGKFFSRVARPRQKYQISDLKILASPYIPSQASFGILQKEITLLRFCSIREEEIDDAHRRLSPGAFTHSRNINPNHAEALELHCRYLSHRYRTRRVGPLSTCTPLGLCQVQDSLGQGVSGFRDS